MIKDQYNWNVKGNGWTLHKLNLLDQVGNDISKVVGGDYYLRKLFGSVDFDLKDMNHGGLGDAHHVSLNSGYFGKWTVAHELGHSLDGAYNWKLSRGLMEFTGGSSPGVSLSFLGGPVCPDSTAPRCNWALYDYGGVPAKGSDYYFNRYEDFAESFAALVYPDQAKQAIENRFKQDPPHLAMFLYEDYITTPRGMWMSATVYLLSR